MELNATHVEFQTLYAVYGSKVRSGGTSGNTISTRRHIPEDGFLHSHRRGNLKSYFTVRLRKLKTICLV
jgi:hypothetical protein